MADQHSAYLRPDGTWDSGYLDTSVGADLQGDGSWRSYGLNTPSLGEIALAARKKRDAGNLVLPDVPVDRNSLNPPPLYEEGKGAADVAALYKEADAARARRGAGQPMAAGTQAEALGGQAAAPPSSSPLGSLPQAGGIEPTPPQLLRDLIGFADPRLGPRVMRSAPYRAVAGVLGSAVSIEPGRGRGQGRFGVVPGEPPMTGLSRGEMSREEIKAAAADASQRAEQKLSHDNRTGVVYNPPSRGVTESWEAAGPQLQPEDESLADQFARDREHTAALNAAGEKQRMAPVPGIRAFRTANGHITFTNLPGRYAGNEEVTRDQGAQQVRGEVQGAPPDESPSAPQNYETNPYRALVARARARSASPQYDVGDKTVPELSSNVELSPADNGLATPGYYNTLRSALMDSIQNAGLHSALATAQMTPAFRAQLDAFINHSKNNGLGVLEYSMAKLAEQDKLISAANQQLQVPQSPAALKLIKDTLAQAEASKESIKQMFAFANKQTYFGGGQATGAGGDTTPGQ